MDTKIESKLCNCGEPALVGDLLCDRCLQIWQIHSNEESTNFWQVVGAICDEATDQRDGVDLEPAEVL